jgi:hypothetical protein
MRAYKNGDYFKACFDAIEKLKSSPNNKKAIYVLTNSYPLAQQDALRAIDNSNMGNTDDKYDIQVANYESLNALANAIYHCPRALEIIPRPSEFTNELNVARQNAAERSYNLGTKALNTNNMYEARNAFRLFTKCNNYVRAYKDVINKIEEAKYKGTLRVIVERPITSRNLQYNADFFYNNLLSDMKRATAGRFVRFYTYDEANQENMRNPHQTIQLNFEQFTLGNIQQSTNTEEFRKDSVVVGTVKVDGKTYNSYNTVTCKLTTNTRELISNGVLNLTIYNSINNSVLEDRKFPGNYVWTIIWATYNGDERAIPNNKKKYLGLNPSMIPPSPQDMFVGFTTPIYRDVINYIQAYYRNEL